MLRVPAITAIEAIHNQSERLLTAQRCRRREHRHGAEPGLYRCAD
jgi:hypothetical protein